MRLQKNIIYNHCAYLSEVNNKISKIEILHRVFDRYFYCTFLLNKKCKHMAKLFSMGPLPFLFSKTRVIINERFYEIKVGCEISLRRVFLLY